MPPPHPLCAALMARFVWILLMSALLRNCSLASPLTRCVVKPTFFVSDHQQH